MLIIECVQQNEKVGNTMARYDIDVLVNVKYNAIFFMLIIECVHITKRKVGN